jgi:2-keto-3-deoxy-L-rhamnonate aldolase RhmA
MEHGAFSLPEVSAMVAGFQGGHCTPIIRVPAVRRDAILPALDLGVGGIMVPGVETAQEVRDCIEFMKYPPQGSRGLSFSRPHNGFASLDRDRYVAEANARNLLMIQIESPRGVENLEEILDVPGIDVVFVGCADLSLSMGIPNDPNSGPLRATLENVLRKTDARGLIGGANLTRAELIDALFPLGLRIVTCATDTKCFLDGLSNPLKSLNR